MKLISPSLLILLTPLSILNYVISLNFAYIITTKTTLPDDIINSVVFLGFTPKIFPAFQPFQDLYPDKAALYYGCFNSSYKFPKLENYENTTFNLISTFELSLVCSHYHVMNQIALDSEIEDSEWAIIMEDDAILVPSVNSSSAKSYFLAAINKSNEINGREGFIYLGLCGPTCRKHESSRILGIDCIGICTHAYALKKYTAKTIFFKFYNNDTVKTHQSLQSDRAFLNYFSSFPSPEKIQSILVGEDITSPDDESHKGIFFQCNRTSGALLRGTSLRDNSFIPLKCFELKIVSSSLGEVMLEYAIVAEFCIKNNLQPVYCAALNKHSKELMQSNFSNVLTIFHYCKHPIYITIHRNVIYSISDVKGTHYNQQLYSNNTVSNLFETNIRNYLMDIYKSIKKGSVLNKSNNNTISIFKPICICLPNYKHRHGNSTTIIQFYKSAVSHLLSLPEVLKVNIPSLSLSFFGDINSNSGRDDIFLIKEIKTHFNLSITTDRPIYLDEINIIRTLSNCRFIIFPSGLNNWWGSYLAGREAHVVTMKKSHYYAKSISWVYL